MHSTAGPSSSTWTWALSRAKPWTCSRRGIGLPVAFRVEAHGPGPFVRADPAALEQVIVNLLDNAVKDRDTVREVTVRIGTRDAHAVVEVADLGIGIAPAEQARIFERFYRGSEASHPRQSTHAASSGPAAATASRPSAAGLSAASASSSAGSSPRRCLRPRHPGPRPAGVASASACRSCASCRRARRPRGRAQHARCRLDIPRYAAPRARARA